MNLVLAILALTCGVLLMLYAGVGFGRELAAGLGALLVFYCVVALALWRWLFGKDDLGW